MRIGIICGNDLPDLIVNSEKLVVETPYGKSSFLVSDMLEHQIFFINRQGKNSDIPLHKINYLANIHALSSARVDCILSVDYVLSLNENIYPGDFVLPHDFIDFTKIKNYYFEDEKQNLVNMRQPFCVSLKHLLFSSCVKLKDFKLHEEGVYLATDCSRSETYTEAKFYSKLADIAGMASVPEAILARQKNICYMPLCIVYNVAEGIQDKLTNEEIETIYNLRKPIFSKVLKYTIDEIHQKRECNCKNNLNEVKTVENFL